MALSKSVHHAWTGLANAAAIVEYVTALAVFGKLGFFYRDNPKHYITVVPRARVGVGVDRE
jgi:hypothetical protein